MRRVFGPRFLVGVALIVAAAVAGVLAGLSTVWVIVVIWVAWLLVTIAEWSLARNAAGRSAARAGVSGSEPLTPPQDPAEPPEPAPEPEVEPDAEPEPASGSEPQTLGPATTPEPESERELAVEPEAADARLEPVPAPEPEPEPEPEQEPEPEPELPPAAVVLARSPGPDGPREWNLWDLERIARDGAGADVARDEERSFLLMYLRQFAGPDGLLPSDFDALVRDSFGDLLGAGRR